MNLYSPNQKLEVVKYFRSFPYWTNRPKPWNTALISQSLYASLVHCIVVCLNFYFFVSNFRMGSYSQCNYYELVRFVSC